MRRLAAASILLLAVGCSKTPSLTADGVAAEIRSEGARPVVHRLWDSGQFDQILNAISSGNGEWIALSPALAGGADAGAAEGLGVALARALPRNAPAVLSVLDPGQPTISVSRVCGLPFVEGSIQDVDDYRRKAEAAVAEVHGASLQERKAGCLAALRQ